MGKRIIQSVIIILLLYLYRRNTIIPWNENCLHGRAFCSRLKCKFKYRDTHTHTRRVGRSARKIKKKIQIIIIILIKITHRPNSNNNNLNRSGDRRGKVVGGWVTTPEQISRNRPPGGWPACLGYIYIILYYITCAVSLFFCVSLTRVHNARHGSRGSRDRQGRPGKIVFIRYYYLFFFSLYILCNTNAQIWFRALPPLS